METSRERLDSWKAIADYLGRDRTTVMRWERTAALPVRRVQGGRGRSVFAYKAEIDRWLAGQATLPDATAPSPPLVASAEPPPPASRMMHRYSSMHPALALGVLAILASGLAVNTWWGSGPPITKALVVGEEIVALDSSGREVWRYVLPDIDGSIVPARLLVTDVDNDNRPDVLAALHFMKHGGHGYGTVMLLDGRGRLRWQRSLDDHYQFGTVDYAPVWFPDDILVYRSGGPARIAVAHHHHTWWPSVIVTYDSDGQPLGRFVNAGWIRSLNMTADGRYLLAAGISNSFGGAVLAVLDAANPVGTSPSDRGSLPPCSNCPSGSPVAYFLMPWTELARPSDTPAVIVQASSTGGIEWHAVQRAEEDGRVPEVIVSLSPSLQVLRQQVNDYFVETRALLERTGQLPQPPAGWRLPAVREWTPARGWQDAVPR